MYRYLYSKLVYPLYHRVTGSGAVSAVRELEAHDHLSTKELRDLEKTKLRCLLSHAGKHVPYYKDVIEKSGLNIESLAEPAGFSALPELSKATIRQQGERLHSTMLDGNRLDPNSTSGSTGSPMEFFTDLRSKAYRKATVFRNRRWLGIKIGEPVVHIWGSPIDQERAEAFRGRIHAGITRETFLSAYEIGDAEFLKYAEVLKRSGASLLIGYPSVLSEFARFCDSRSIRFPKLRAVIVSAEALYKHHRQVIEEKLDTRLFNRYGCREVGDIAHEIPGQAGLVVNSDRVLVEIVDERGEPCAVGNQGRILVTDLDNYGMPLIRYDIGDSASWAPSGEGRGRLPYPVLESVEGRSLDIVSSPGGARVGGTFWTILLRKRPGFANFQVIQEKPDGVQIRYVRDSDTAEIDFAYFSSRIAEHFGVGFRCTFTEVDRIEPEANGKFRLVISRLKQDASPIAETGRATG